MTETRLEFRYTRSDVVAAQRMRFLRSNQFKIILIIWFLSMLVLIAPLVLPRVFPPGPNTSWAAVLQIAIAFLVTLLVLIFITPWMDFYINRFWRLPLSLHFSDRFLRIFVTGKTGGLRLKWGQVRRVDESERFFILEYGAGGKYIILPRSAFTRPGDEQRFRDLLARREAVKDAPSEDEDDCDDRAH
jgi:hypothetical protein